MTVIPKEGEQVLRDILAIMSSFTEDQILVMEAHEEGDTRRLEIFQIDRASRQRGKVYTLQTSRYIDDGEREALTARVIRELRNAVAGTQGFHDECVVHGTARGELALYRLVYLLDLTNREYTIHIRRSPGKVSDIIYFLYIHKYLHETLVKCGAVLSHKASEHSHLDVLSETIQILRDQVKMKLNL